MHAGAEGTQYQHVTGQEEIYFGEDRGNPEAFAHAAIDAGADLVIASGPARGAGHAVLPPPPDRLQPGELRGVLEL